MTCRVSLLVAALVVQPLASDDVLEPSVENEVVAALDRAPKGDAPTKGDATAKGDATFLSRAEERYLHAFATNGLSATARAIRLVSTQRADGRWREGTNDVTRAAVKILKELIDEDPLSQ